MTRREFIALDGGWGWLIVCGAGLSSMFIVPVSQVFSMIYGNKFEELGISATEMSIIMNVNQAFGMILALANVPLLRNYGYRKIAVIGQLLYSSGIILTSFATCFIHFIITYGMITSLGSTMSFSANMLAVNTYFNEKRGQAVGVYMLVAGLGQIFVPHVISLILSIYNSEGTMLILGGMTLNHIIGALLLHPIEWHAKRVNNAENKSESIKTIGDDANINHQMRKLSILGLRSEDVKKSSAPRAKNKFLLMGMIQQVAMILDLELLRDTVYMTTFTCLSFVLFVELNFNVLMPLILDELRFDMNSIATMLSVLGIADLVFRGLAPYIGEWLRQPPMAMLFFSLVINLISRMALIFTQTYVATLIVSISLGVAKGFRIVYMNILISTSAPLEKFAAASSIQNLGNGCIMLIASPVLGLIKDIAGSYILCIIFLNIITLLILIMLLGLFATKYIKNRKKLNTFYELEHVCKKCDFNCQ
ncbi:PREDICTED: monocarboxylate transporter 4-like [Ceratosolen solmsi marchali]|uniref:Monocarboxylate transporter 4-like n=1 Tax=Ceratosolen solmsi marchali TaxID=326594 RepID=A0AAJ6YNX7_9HYME|nr:PREDICTED: monocarboxylate transporter 4-like [Ceratosolen solmsi marchali]